MSVFLYPQAPFPAASRTNGKVSNVVGPTFHNSFDDVHLLYEVRQIYLLISMWSVKPVNKPRSYFFLCLSTRFCWMTFTLRTVDSFQCKMLNWPPSARQDTCKSSVRRSFPGSYQTYLSSSLIFQITSVICNRTTLNASCWPWCTQSIRWLLPPANITEIFGRSPLLVYTELSSRIWQGQIRQIQMLLHKEFMLDFTMYIWKTFFKKHLLR